MRLMSCWTQKKKTDLRLLSFKIPESNRSNRLLLSSLTCTVLFLPKRENGHWLSLMKLIFDAWWSRFTWPLSEQWCTNLQIGKDDAGGLTSRWRHRDDLTTWISTTDIGPPTIRRFELTTLNNKWKKIAKQQNPKKKSNNIFITSSQQHNNNSATTVWQGRQFGRAMNMAGPWEWQGQLEISDLLSLH